MKYLSLTFLVLIGFNIFVWRWVIAGEASRGDLDIYFLDVGQGDSSLVELPGGVQILIDGGPGNKVLSELDKILPPIDRYVDLLVLSHAETDHFTGFIPVLERYEVGAFIYNGRDGVSKEWEELAEVIRDRDVPVIVLGEGDKINYRDSKFEIFSPGEEFLRKREVNESSIVGLLQSEGVAALFTGDAGFEVENYIADKYDLDVDVLKVGHHGSKYATSSKLLDETTPAVSVIQVGENRYGHPTYDVLNRLAAISSSIYRNDTQGLIHLRIKDGLLNVFAEK